ncbi:hypothetical protein JD490_18255 [Aeromonas dhakensis]|uniref:hypothetical protein n=1 Tax=Aeromonas dhakensis TaxID=196024 RepID=UPI00191D52E7|nr:hypothetical protein [Aeromonas dhakensis]MBL0526840.1 hypothetical protein [Aeromonas dhakensis]
MEHISSLRLSQDAVNLEPSPTQGKQDIGIQCDGLGLEPPRLQAHPEAPNLNELQQTADEATQKARQCGVDMAKRSFIAKVLTLVAASAVLVAAALVTSFTGGAGIPLLALAGVGFAMAVGDVACAYKDWQSKKQGGEGLAMGGDALGNAIHWLGKRCGASDEKAERIATYTSLLTRGALAVGTVAIGGFLPVAAPAALAHAMPAITVGKVAVEIVAGGVNANATRKGEQQQAQKLEAQGLHGQLRGHQAAADRLLPHLDQAQIENADLQSRLGQVNQDLQAHAHALEQMGQDQQQLRALLAEGEKKKTLFIDALAHVLQNPTSPPLRRHSLA